MYERIKNVRGKVVDPGPDFWESAFLITALLIGLIFGGAIGWYGTENILALGVGLVLGLFISLIGVGMGLKELPKSMSGYLGYTLMFLWMGLIFILLFVEGFAIAAATCIGPMLLLLIVTYVSSSIEKRRDKSKLDTYFEKITSLFGDEGIAVSNAREHARKLTLQLLPQLGKDGKKHVLLSLYEKKLIVVEEKHIDLGGADLSCISLESENLNQICLEGANLRKAHLKRAELRGASFRKSNLSNATLEYADLSQANLSEVNLSRSILGGSKLCSANLALANLAQSKLNMVDLREANLSNTDCRGVNFFKSDLRSVDLRGADLSGAQLKGALLDNAYIFGAKITTEQLMMASSALMVDQETQ
jgi:uncharacterized protein YjbI with pentapeptide repeats